MADACGAPGPAAQGRRAQLVLALLLTALFPMFLLNHPVPTHVVWLDLPWLGDERAAAAWTDGGYHMSSLPPLIEWETPRAVHRLEVTPDEKILLNGSEVDLVTLRMHVDRIVAGDREWIDYRPEPWARYELFLEVFAITKRASLERLRLDNSRFGEAIAE